MTLQRAESVIITWADGGIEQYENINVQAITSVNTDIKAQNKDQFHSINLPLKKRRVISPSPSTELGVIK